MPTEIKYGVWPLVHNPLKFSTEEEARSNLERMRKDVVSNRKTDPRLGLYRYETNTATTKAIETDLKVGDFVTKAGSPSKKGLEIAFIGTLKCVYFRTKGYFTQEVRYTNNDGWDWSHMLEKVPEEPKFKTGDWVENLDGLPVGNVIQVGEMGTHVVVSPGHRTLPVDRLRLHTPRKALFKVGDKVRSKRLKDDVRKITRIGEFGMEEGLGAYRARPLLVWIRYLGSRHRSRASSKPAGVLRLSKRSDRPVRYSSPVGRSSKRPVREPSSWLQAGQSQNRGGLGRCQAITVPI